MDLRTPVKIRAVILLVMAFISYGLYDAYEIAIDDIMGIVKSRSIVYLNWRSIPIFLVLPTGIYYVFFYLCVVCSRGLMPYRFLYHGLIIALGYGGLAIVFGTVLSIVLNIYPLSTDYTYCQGSGAFSGISYAKNKSICEQMKIAWENGGVKAVKELNDKLDSIPPHQ